MYRKNTSKLLLAFTVIGAIILLGRNFGITETQTKAPHNTENVIVGSVIDGDTFVTTEGVTVRLIGIDAPERHEAYYGYATDALSTLIPPGTSIALSYGKDRFDPYNRTLAHVWSNDKHINAVLVEIGAAVVMTIPPNTQYAPTFRQAAEYAQSEEVGLWGE